MQIFYMILCGALIWNSPGMKNRASGMIHVHPCQSLDPLIFVHELHECTRMIFTFLLFTNSYINRII